MQAGYGHAGIGLPRPASPAATFLAVSAFVFVLVVMIPAPADTSSPKGGPNGDPNVPAGGWTSRGLGDVKNDWRRAAGSDATSKPNFDRDNPWRKSPKAY